MYRAAVLFAIASIAFMAACSSGISLPHTVVQRSVDDAQQQVAGLIDNRIPASDRNLLADVAIASIGHGRHWAPSDLIIIGVLDHSGNVEKTLTNRYADMSHRVIRETERPSATDSATPTYPEAARTLLADLPGPSPTPYPNSGPYHQLWANYSPGTNGASATVTIPCSATINDPSNATPYVYFSGIGGQAQTPKIAYQRAEAGEQFNFTRTTAGGSQSATDIQPYIRVSSIIGAGSSGAASSSLYTATQYNSGWTNDTEWGCSASNITLAMSFTLENASYQGKYGVLFVNISQQVINNTYRAVQFAVFENANSNTTNANTENWNGWNATCDGCRMAQTVSIGQVNQMKNNGDVFGPVTWAQEVVSGSDASLQLYDQCLNYPGWTSHPWNECGNTPSSGRLNSVIQISGQSNVGATQPEYGTEKVTINNGNGTWLH